jgi:hypothetical protein
MTTEVLPLVELLVNVSVPVAAPIAVGPNATCNLIAMFGLNVTGKVAPEIVNPVPLRLAALTVTAELPVEVKVTDCVAGLPRGTLPKFKLVVLKVNTGFVLVLPPVPLRLTVIVEPVEELLAMERAPASAPATCGSKLT